MFAILNPSIADMPDPAEVARFPAKDGADAIPNAGNAAWNEPGTAVNGAALAAVSTPNPGKAACSEPGAGVNVGATSKPGNAN
jgi:hypothetical protein